MIDDFYAILRVKPNASLYKIALHYKILAKNLILSNNEFSKTDFYQVNTAFEVLKNEHVREYYNILHKILIQKWQTNISFQTIEQYLSIVNNQAIKGKERADKIINNESPRLLNHIKKPLVLSFLIETIKLYNRYPHLGCLPLFGFCLLIIGLIVFVRDMFGFSSDFGLIGLIFFFWGIISIYANFRYFTIDVMNEEYPNCVDS